MYVRENMRVRSITLVMKILNFILKSRLTTQSANEKVPVKLIVDEKQVIFV